jgi:ABC-type transporter lipoprotein component MlaA/pimeloyl-ACP methyl ester carboxylesterase
MLASRVTSLTCAVEISPHPIIMRLRFTTPLASGLGRPFFRLWLPVGVIAPLVTLSCSTTSPPRDLATSTSGKKGAQSSPSIAAEFIADPLEPLNRGVWEVNRGILVGVLKPTGRVYRTIVPPPARRSIRNFSRNLAYPGRLVNHLLQGRWQGAGDESLRFICNTTAGVGGFFDVASRWDIPKSNADFAQTFNGWGWQPNAFVMLPFLGPSDDTHATGSLFDRAADPLNYFPPYNFISTGGTFNGLFEQTEELARFTRSESDSYAGTKYFWTYASKHEAPDWTTTGPKDISTLQTLNVGLIRPKNPEFLRSGRVMDVRLPSTGRNMKFNCWMQPSTAPLVMIAPGLGSHRMSSHILFVAESLYQQGFSVVTTTGTFHPEFMENASTAALPGYPPVDCNDLLVELTEIDRALEKKFPGRLGKKALVGISMGGFQALYLAAREKNESPGMLRFDRYVAIDTPVDLYANDAPLDDLFDAPLAWPIEQRQARINNTLHKAAALMTMPPSPNSAPPFDAIESKYLVGLSFRLTLRDTIFNSQSRKNLGILQAPLSPWRREEAYREIMDCSFADYSRKFAAPYFESQGISQSKFVRELNLRTHQDQLGSQKKVRVVINQNDFLLKPGDVSWLKSTIAPSHLKVFPDGGHLGNLASPASQEAITKSLNGLK